MPGLLVPVLKGLIGPAGRAFAVAAAVALLAFGIYRAGTLAQRGKTEAALARAGRAEQTARDNAAAAVAARADAERLARIVTDATEAFARDRTRAAATAKAAESGPDRPGVPGPVGSVLDVLRRPR